MQRCRIMTGPLAILAIAVLCLVPGNITAATSDRTIALYNIHTKETVKVTFRKGGRLQPDAITKINWALRDWRRNEPTEMDVRLIDLLWEIHRELGSKEPIHVISGYRSPATNNMLRQSRGGQAKKSRHMVGQAADVHFPDIPLRQLRYSALIREQGGVGYYPTSAIPFVHVDTGNVRAWPRLPREELALLFPSGRTQHLPASGDPITSADAREARRTRPDLVRTITAFNAVRSGVQQPTMVAGLGPVAIPMPKILERPTNRSPSNETAPQLVALPRRAEPPAPRQSASNPLPKRTAPPTTADRDKLTELAALAAETAPELIAPPSLARPPAPPVEEAEETSRQARPETQPDNSTATTHARFAFAASWVAAPEYDDEHPGELTYRPFAIRPYLTTTHSMDEPTLTRLTYRASNRVMALLDESQDLPMLQLRPDRMIAEAKVAGEAEGRPVDTALLTDPRSGSQTLPSQHIHTKDYR